MNQISQKLQSITKKLRNEAKQNHFKQMRQQIRRSWNEEAQPDFTDEIFKLTIHKVQQGQADLVNIFANLKQLLYECLIVNRPKNRLRRKVALWIFVKLVSSQQVLDFMADCDLEQNWKNLTQLLQQQSRCRQYLYQAMKNFLQIARFKFGLLPYHNLESLYLNQALKYIFNQQITSKLLSIEPQDNQDSEYHYFMATYISLVPKQHLVPIINEGYPLRVLQLPNKRVFYSILSRLQCLSEEDKIYAQILQDFLHKKEEFELIFAGFQVQ